MDPFEIDAVKRMDAIPEFDKATAQNVIAEIGMDMKRFPTAHHLASWAGICPGKRKNAEILAQKIVE